MTRSHGGQRPSDYDLQHAGREPAREVRSVTADQALREALQRDPSMSVDEYLRRQKAVDDERVGVDSPNYRALYARWLRDGDATSPTLQDELLRADQYERELRDLGVGTSAAGGYTVPPDMVRRLLFAMKRASAMLRVCDPITTMRGGPTSVPLVDDTATSGLIVTEAGAGTVDTATPFAERAFGRAYMYHSRVVKASWQLVQDLGFPVESWLPRLLAARIARAADPHFTTGSGSGQPTGLIATVTVGKQGVAGQTLTVKWVDLIDVIHSVDVDYREDQPPAGMVGSSPTGS